MTQEARLIYRHSLSGPTEVIEPPKGCEYQIVRLRRDGNAETTDAAPVEISLRIRRRRDKPGVSPKFIPANRATIFRGTVQLKAHMFSLSVQLLLLNCRRLYVDLKLFLLRLPDTHPALFFKQSPQRSHAAPLPETGRD